MTNIKAIITDVDGVLVGSREGFNFPLPHADVIHALNYVANELGVPIVLCTAKYGNAIRDIALQAKLANPHITDGGAVVIDWLDNRIVSQRTLDSDLVQAYVRSCLDKDIYIELYTAGDYYLQSSQRSDFTPRRSKVVLQDPHLVDSLLDTAATNNIIKMISFCKDEADMKRIEENFRGFEGKLSYVWSQNAFLAPRRPMIITKPGVSKRDATREVVDFLGISLDDTLGIGDTESDWNFMQLCGYVATVGDEIGNLQELSRSKGDGHYYFAGPADDHGLLEIFRHFGLIR